MLKARIIPTLLLKNESLIKTKKFKQYSYIGDPINTVRIFNELEVDELMFLDIFATVENRPINFKILKNIADECFMPLSYGGNIRTLEDAKKVFAIGFEKIVINSFAYEDLDFISKLATYFGSQSVVVSIDYKKTLSKGTQIKTRHGTKKIKGDVLQWAKTFENAGAGELLLTSIDSDGSWLGYDTELIKQVTSQVKVPVIANGGAGQVSHFDEAINQANASACSVGSMVVYQKKGMGVLINFPDQAEIERVI